MVVAAKAVAKLGTCGEIFVVSRKRCAGRAFHLSRKFIAKILPPLLILKDPVNSRRQNRVLVVDPPLRLQMKGLGHARRTQGRTMNEKE